MHTLGAGVHSATQVQLHLKYFDRFLDNKDIETAQSVSPPFCLVSVRILRQLGIIVGMFYSYCCCNSISSLSGSTHL